MKERLPGDGGKKKAKKYKATRKHGDLSTAFGKEKLKGNKSSGQEAPAGKPNKADEALEQMVKNKKPSLK